ncbi:hypothetical protein [Roseovarius sp. D22-M7]|uniref:hypothetical protein n=1 Tax=Roseovarius sp. D22-M7 TaxID=3127116 RepID=UPI00301028B1
MSFEDKKNSLSLPHATAIGPGRMIGAGENGAIGPLHLDLPTSGIPTLILCA